MGVPAWEAIIEALLQDMETTSRAGALFVDLNVKVPNALVALVHKQKAFNSPLLMIGLCNDMVEYTWVEHTLRETIASMVREGT